MEHNDPARNFYLLGMPFVATVGSRGYFLVMADEPFIVEALPGPSKTATIEWNIPAEVAGKRPALPEKRGISSAPGLFKALEHASVPSGIYGWKDGLYILSRKPKDAGLSAWSIKEVKPGENKQMKVSSSWGLGVSANHITLVPGNDRWAVVAKGEVVNLGDQKLLSILLLDARAFSAN
jgi:hypothetical protein